MSDKIREAETVRGGEEKGEIELESVITINRDDGARQSNTNIGHHPSMARRSGSATRLVHGDNGLVKVQRTKSSGTSEMMIAVQRKVSGVSTLLSVIPRQESSPEFQVNAENLLDVIGGKGATGAYSEHMIPLEVLIPLYNTHMDFSDATQSRGLTSKKAKELLEEYGPNVLTPPVRVPRWLLFLLQFSNLLMILLLLTSALCLILYLIDMSNPDNLYLCVILFLVVLFTCHQTYSLEAKSDELMEKFREMVPEKTTVIRDGIAQTVDTTDIVVGDVLRLGLGDKVPADCRVIYNQSMKIDQSMITGESEPVESTVLAEKPNALEARNLIFKDSLVVNGSCFAMAVRTGDATLIGTMVEMTRAVRKGPTPLSSDIGYFVRILALFALTQAVVVFIVSMARGLDPAEVFVQSFVVIIISNVNQGIPSTVTASLVLVAEQMAKHNVFVKSLDIIEALGSCSMICTDKTGTLTTNDMTVVSMWCFDAMCSAATFQVDYRTTVDHSQINALVEAATLNSSVFMQKSEDSESEGGSNVTVPSGDATELGLYKYMAGCLQGRDGTDIESYRAVHTKVHEVPFNSSCKWQMSVHAITTTSTVAVGKDGRAVAGPTATLVTQSEEESTDNNNSNGNEGDRNAGNSSTNDCSNSGASNSVRNGSGKHSEQDETKLNTSTTTKQFVMIVKGAPEMLLDQCSHYLSIEGKEMPIDDAFRARYTVAQDHFGNQGQRVLAFARRVLDPTVYKTVEQVNQGVAVEGLVMIGLVSLQEPTRQEVPQAIKDCRAAGVQVVLMSGDDPATAAAIARQIGLITLPTRDVLARERAIPVVEVPEDDVKAVVVHGASIASMTEEDWRVLVTKEQIVFARTTPEQKLTIVKEFTKAGHVVAMTGDGVNDAPALKQAAIGIAMGVNGSDVAREAAEIVLMNDDFASIVVGIRVGRLLFANLKKSIAYSSASIMPEVIPVLLWGFVGVPQPMGALLVLGVNLFTDLAPTSSLAYEEPEAHLMTVPPRNIQRDKLTSIPLLLYSYLFAGVIITGGCLLTYFRIFASYGVSAADIYKVNNKYFPALHKHNIYHTTDGSGRVYDAADQDHIMDVARAAWFMMIVTGQAAHLWVCRTTTVSIFQQGVFSNKFVNMAVPLAIGLGCFVIFLPGLREIVGADTPPQLEIVYASIMVGVLLWTLSEARKWYTRKEPKSWLNRNILAW